MVSDEPKLKTDKNLLFKTPQSLNAAIKNICDILRRSNCAGAMQYIPELTWLLFLRLLDEWEEKEKKEATQGLNFSFSLNYPYRWQEWASPSGTQRLALQMSKIGALLDFVNHDLIPYLKNLKYQAGATNRQKIISAILSNIERLTIDTEANFIEVLDKLNIITSSHVDKTHIFTISQVYEGLLLKMGEKGGDGGQFFTPREIVRVMTKVIAPQLGETIYDPCCGTGGFLAQSYEFIREKLGPDITESQLELLKRQTFYGREKEKLIFPIALANLVLHGIDEPYLWHGNTLTSQSFYDDLFQQSPSQFDVILTNPPFGGKEGKECQSNFAFKTSSTQILFLQHTINSLKPGGRCGIVLDEGVLFRTNEAAFVGVKQKLITECNLWCIVSLPAGVFANAGTSLKTNLLFFTKGQPTTEIWYYDLSDIKVTKKNPLTMDNFADFFCLLPTLANSGRSWTVSRQVIEEKGYDLKAVNPLLSLKNNTKTRQELLKSIETKSQEIVEILETLKPRHSQ